MAETINLHRAKTNLSRLVDRAAAGEEIILARNGEPVARLVALERSHPGRRPGRLAGKIRVAEEFDAALPPDLLAAFHAGAVEPPDEPVNG